MSSYQIADLEQLTGIKAHTIRIWEKRYKLIEPHRTPTNIRYYDDEQVRKLLNVATLLACGGKISHIAELSDEQLNKQIQESQDQPSEDNSSTSFVNSLTAAMINYDEPGFDKIFSAAITRFGVYNAMIKVFYPFLFKTGILWITNEAMPSQEHFASNIIRRKLLAAIDGLMPAKKRNKKFVLFLPPGEWHEIGLLLSDYILRFNGCETIYLGQNVPYENLNAVITKLKPNYLLTFYVSRIDEYAVNEALKELCKCHKDTEILVSGSNDVVKHIKPGKRVTILKNPDQLLNLF